MTFTDFDIQSSLNLRKKYISSSPRIGLAVSGGVDSMVLATLFLSQLEILGIPLTNVIIIHLHHGIRTQSDTELEQIISFFSPLFPELKLITRHKSTTTAPKSTEQALRKRRYTQFADIASEHKLDLLMTGHHLNDRVESTFLHLLRGAGKDGFLSMLPYESHHLLPTTKILRPLLSRTKKNIERFAQDYSIPYSIDQSNLDPNISKRNYLRQNILPQLFALGHTDDSFLDSMQTLYSELESASSDFSSELSPISLVDARQAERGYEYRPATPISQASLLSLLKHLGVAQNLTTRNLTDITNFLTTKNSGHKFINGVSIFICHTKYYFIKTTREFRKTPNHTFIPPTPEGSTGHYRYPRSGDHIHGKTRKQYCIRQKIPIFYRDRIPIPSKK